MENHRVYCTACGSANMAEARFCFKCGAPIAAATPVIGAPPPLGEVPPPVHASAASPAPVQPRVVPGTDFITLACPSCGGKLSITSNMERFACGFCGNEHIVRRVGGTVSLEPVMDKLNQISDNLNSMGSGISRFTAIAEKQAAEAAIKRLNGEIEELHKEQAKLYDNSNTGWSVFGISAVVMAMSIFVLVIDHGETGLLKVIFYPGAILGGLMTVLGIIVLLAISSDRKKGLQRTDALLQQKNQELQRNRQIVNS